MSAPSPEGEFVGYHGTSSPAVPDLLRGIETRTGRNLRGFAQLGIGFYTIPDLGAASYFAELAVDKRGGTAAILEVFARDFARMSKRAVPQDLWWNILATSRYVTGYDYLTAPTVGFEHIEQVKFNPRAYHALTVRQRDA